MPTDIRKGGCHCQRIRYEVEIDLSEPVIECNCSHCEPKGFLLSFVPAEKFKLLQGEDSLTEYRFNTEQIAHYFCKVCGLQPFSRGDSTEGPGVMINVRTVDGVDLAALTRMPFDGKSR